ncbi:MAG: hypothetical protein H6719_27770 [Sandaracinaceae bacterium]|nr:hypothetical protein [Sandaracinaceae bacterium]
MLRTTAALAFASLALTACDGTPPADVDAGGMDTDAGDMGTDAATVDCSGRPSNAPVTRSETGMVYDAARDRLVIYGGNTAASERCAVPPSEVVDELWAFHFDCGNWEQLNATGGPGLLVRHATVLDTMRNRMLLFGGRSSSSAYSNAVWAFDLATDTWSEVATTGTAPAPVAEAIATYDAPRDRLVVFGGDPGGFVGSDGMYSLDLATNTWSEITAAGAPSARLYHSSTQVGDELFVFGGATGFNPPYFNDVHGFDLATDTWRTVATTNDPQPRFGAELVADPANGRLLMAFGHDDAELGNRNDVYALDIATGAWSQLHTGDTFNNPPTGMCEFPADFTIVEDGTPERRYSIGLAQTGSVAYVFGGKADCGYLNDVWSLDIGSGAWTRVRASTGGEGCLRTGRTDCTTLCF